MLNKFVAIGLGAVIALAPLAAVAQTEQLAQAAPAATDTTPPAAKSMAKPAHTGSHRGHVRRKGNTAGHRARASAHHMHHMRTNPKPMAPAEAPKS
jgi:hypothetical protein